MTLCPKPTVPDTFGLVSPVTPGPSTTTALTLLNSDAGRARPALPVPPTVRRPPEDAFAADGRSTRWADHREARRAELVRIARRTVHHKGPDVSMEEIAAAAGTSKSIVYRYFADKTGLQIAVAEAVVLQIQGALEGVLRIAPTPRDGLRAMVAVYLEMIESSPNVYAFVTRNGSVESGGPLGHFLDSVTAMVAAPFARGLTEEHDGRRTARRPEASEGAHPEDTALAGPRRPGRVLGRRRRRLRARFRRVVAGPPRRARQPGPRGDHRPGRRLALGRTRRAAGP